MTKLQKILAATLVCTIPVGVFAYDKYDKHEKHDIDDHKKSSYHYDKYEGEYDFDDDLDYELLEKSGINLVFEGKVEERPKAGYNGVWKISGQKIIVDDTTMIFLEKSKISVKDEVEILAKRENGKITAVIIEQD